MASDRSVHIDLASRRRTREVGRVPSTVPSLGVSVSVPSGIAVVSSSGASVVAVSTPSGDTWDLSIPANAIEVTPATLANAINNNPGGTNFKLTAGTYNGSFPNKSGNGYYGENPENPHAVTFDGNTTYSRSDIDNDDNQGNLATSGTRTIMGLQASNTFAHMAWKRYRCESQKQGPFTNIGVNNVRIDNVRTYEQQYAGLKVGGSGWVISHFHGYHNGQFGINGGGSGNHICRDFEFYENGIEDPAWGIPRWKTSDRGASKIVLCDGFTFQDGLTRDHDDQGIWFDIGNRNCVFRRVTSRNNRKNGLDLEASFGGHIIEDCVVENSAFATPTQSWRFWGIMVSMSSDTIVRNNYVTGCRNGIGLYQWNHPQYSQGNCDSVTDVTVRDNEVANITNHWGVMASLTTFNGLHIDSSGANNQWINNTYVGVSNTSPSNAFWLRNQAVNYATWKNAGWD